MSSLHPRSPFFTIVLVLGVGCGGGEVGPPETDVRAVAADPAPVDQPLSPVASDPVDFPAAPAVDVPNDPPVDEPEPRPTRRSVEEIVEAVGDGIVLITTKDALGGENGQGTGFVVGADGLVATNLHVLANAVSATATFRDGRECAVSGTVACWAERDLALIRIDDADGADVLVVAREIAPRQGEEVLAIGHPEGFQFTVSTGIVSALRTTPDLPPAYQNALQTTEDTRWIQTSAAISVGSSGGPLLDRTGRVIGLTTWIAAGENLGFAVNAEHLRTMLAETAGSPVESLPIRGSGLVVDPGVAAAVMAAERARAEWASNFNAAVNEKERQRIAAEENPIPEHAERLWKVADEADDEAVAIDALVGMLSLLHDPSRKSRAILDRVLQRLRERHFDDSRIVEAAPHLAGLSRLEAVEFLDELAERSRSREVRRAASAALSNLLLAADGRYVPLVRRAMRRLAGEYADVRTYGVRGGDYDPGGLLLRVLDTLQVGCMPPSLEGVGADGAPLSLSAERGKVVYLDFWSDDVPACRAAYATKNVMLKRFEDQPFTLLGVNRDAPGTLRRLVADGTIAWRNWADGPEGPIQKAWDVDLAPMTFLYDPSGRCRRSTIGAEQPALLHARCESLLFEASGVLPFDVVPLGATWRYHASTGPPDEAWRTREYADDDWASGRAPLGFGWGDEATTLPDEPLTYYFRRRFQLDDLDVLHDLGLRVHHDDGIALYVNGIEVVRRALVEEAAHDEFAAGPDDAHGFDPFYVAVPKSALRAGENVLAVEVHQARLGRADVRFDLAAGRNWVPVLREALAGDSTPHLVGTLAAVSGLEEAAAAELAPDVRRLLDREDVAHAFAVRRALAQIEPGGLKEVPGGLPGSDAVTDEQHELAASINAGAWSVAFSPRYSRDDYRRVLAFLSAAEKLVPPMTLLDETRRARAWAHARAGEYEAALKAAHGPGLLRFTYAPWELACQVYCHRALGRADQARQSLDKLEQRIADPEFTFDVESHALYDEVRGDESPSNEPKGDAPKGDEP